jgi:hypothetical protein
MLLPFVGWLYGIPPPTPRGTACLLPNMSESSGTPGENRARGSPFSFEPPSLLEIQFCEIAAFRFSVAKGPIEKTQ